MSITRHTRSDVTRYQRSYYSAASAPWRELLALVFPPWARPTQGFIKDRSWPLCPCSLLSLSLHTSKRVWVTLGDGNGERLGLWCATAGRAQPIPSPRSPPAPNTSLQKRDRGITKPSHVALSPPVQNSRSLNSETALLHPSGCVIRSSRHAFETGLRPYREWISEPGRAARQWSQTAEHDQHKERVRAAATRLVGHITAFRPECVFTTQCTRTQTHTLLLVGVRGVHNKAHCL